MAPHRTIALARHLQQHPEETHTLESLSALCGISPFHLQRGFKSLTGLTPKQFLDAARLRRFKQELRESGDVLDAIYAAGFGAPSRLYEKADAHLGMTPSQYRDGGAGVSISYVMLETAHGLLLIAATDRGVCSVQFGDSRTQLRRELGAEFPGAALTELAQPWPDQMTAWAEAIAEYLAGHLSALRLPLDLRGTTFQMLVWKYLQTIPRGETRSYREVAEGIGRPSAVRAVAGACARNPVAIVVPCHRVIRGTGEAGGYRWGLHRKQALLDAERQSTSAR